MGDYVTTRSEKTVACPICGGIYFSDLDNYDPGHELVCDECGFLLNFSWPLGEGIIKED